MIPLDPPCRNLVVTCSGQCTGSGAAILVVVVAELSLEIRQLKFRYLAHSRCYRAALSSNIIRVLHPAWLGRRSNPLERAHIWPTRYSLISTGGIVEGVLRIRMMSLWWGLGWWLGLDMGRVGLGFGLG